MGGMGRRAGGMAEKEEAFRDAERTEGAGLGPEPGLSAHAFVSLSSLHAK